MTRKNLGIRVPPAIKILPTLSPVARRDTAIRIVETKAVVGVTLRSDAMAEADRRFGVRRWPVSAAWDLSVFSTMVPSGAR
jgi:hypothetical protein